MDKFTEEQIEIMRQDIQSGMALTKWEIKVREQMKKEGKDFDAEFEKWKNEKGRK